MKHRHILRLLGVDRTAFPDGHIPYCIISPWAEKSTLSSFIASDQYDPERDLHRLVRILAPFNSYRCECETTDQRDRRRHVLSALARRGAWGSERRT
jgi:hypothetical protein